MKTLQNFQRRKKKEKYLNWTKPGFVRKFGGGVSAFFFFILNRGRLRSKTSKWRSQSVSIRNCQNQIIHKTGFLFQVYFLKSAEEFEMNS